LPDGQPVSAAKIENPPSVWIDENLLGGLVGELSKMWNDMLV